MLNKRGIYKITNTVNNKVYIGESLNIDKRWNKHKEDLDNNIHHSYKLQVEWNEYGDKKFKFERITVLDVDIKKISDEYILLIYEDYYIKEYDAINNGYNIEDTLEEILNGNKNIIEGINDKYSIEIYQKQILDKKVVNENRLIYNPKFYGFKDLRERINASRSKDTENLLFNNNIVCRSKTHKYKYDLSEKYKNSEDIFLNCESLSSIRFTERGLNLICNMKH